ncbi:MAG TPA: hypothetical protein VKK79_11075 [Candidatus Lokiarchaeia archaeon]|nr:hypothetical protein [Candidatus Lokiarchaeia archaeon]
MPAPKNTPSKGDKGEKKKAARDLVQLKHVEVTPQKPVTLSDTLKEQIEHIKEEQGPQGTLSEDEFAAISAIAENKRLFLVRIQLIVNQARVPLGKEMLHDEEIRSLMDSLVERGYVNSQSVTTEGLGPREVYTLTDEGKDLLQ